VKGESKSATQQKINSSGGRWAYKN